MRRQYIKPIPIGDIALRDQTDVVIDCQVRDLNRVVDESGWTVANEQALARLIGVAWWLTRVQGARFADEILGVLAEQMVKSQQPRELDGPRA